MRLGRILEYFESSAIFSAQDKQKYNHIFGRYSTLAVTCSTESYPVAIDANHNTDQEKLHIILVEFYGWLCKLEQ